MIDALPKTAPIYLDKVRLKKEDQRFFDSIRRYYPELESRYRSIAKEDHDPYYQVLKVLYGGDDRISFVFGEA